MPREERLPFAFYGTLMSDQNNGARLAEDPEAAGSRVLGPCRIPGRIYFAAGPHSFPALVPADDAEVVGELWEPAPDHYADALRRVDAIEGYRPNDGYSMYVRTATTLADGTRAWVYVWNASSHIYDSPIPSGDWRDVAPTWQQPTTNAEEATR